METGIRITCFLLVLSLMATWEALAPRRKLVSKEPARWLNNLALIGINAVLLRLIAPISAVAMALLAEQRGWGLFHFVRWPSWLEITLAVIALDLIIYLQHVLFHAVPMLWRVHRVHHADLDFDVTTGLRFHSIEILLSMAIKVAAVFLLGASATAVVVFEVLLNATSMFSHGNVRLPAWLDRILRLFVVTPDMHRVHHSTLPAETNSNYGFNVPWWDYLLGTYRPQPEKGHHDMQIGLAGRRNEQEVERLLGMLAIPFCEPGNDDRGR